MTDYRPLARSEAQANGLDPDIFERQISQESGWNPYAISRAGAKGIAQFMPGTARGLGVDPFDPVASIKAMAKLMGGYVKKYGGYPSALAAYNAGPGAVEQYNGVPPYAETQHYVKAILGGGTTLPDTAAGQSAASSDHSITISGLGDTLKVAGTSALLAITALVLIVLGVVVLGREPLGAVARGAV